MNIHSLIEKDKQVQKKYNYYRSLGYTDYAAAVFSTVTYGESRTVLLAQKYGADTTRLVSNLYEWLKNKPDKKLREPEDFEEIKCRAMPTMARKSIFPDAVSYRLHASAPMRTAQKEVQHMKMGQMLPLVDSEPLEETADCCVGPDASNVTLKFLKSLSTDSYELIEEKAAKNVFTSPTSTFRMTTSNASMGIVFNQLRNGRRVNMDQVRIEEVLNYFDYNAEAPENDKFRISTELLPKGDSKKLLYIHAQAAEETRDHQNIVLLLDVSGSMCSNEEVTQAAIATIFSKLKIGDKISLVTYSTTDETVLDGYEIRSEQDKETLMGILYGIEINGCTYGSAGIETAYKIGAQNYLKDGNNQVILITDGDLNFGITSKGGLKSLIEEKKKSNLFLSVIGTGLYNYKDDNLEVLAKHGNGTYCVVNDLEDVEESINKRYIALTNIVAKDVKAQVEFNPRFVKNYRLLGYENRELNHEDFTNDAVISEPYGSGSHGVALYELEMAAENSTPASDLKYQTPVLTDSDELGTVKIRYKEPLSDVSHPVEATFFNTDHATANARLAYLLYCISEKLRGSDKLDEADETYLSDMLTDRKYKEIAGTNLEKLELLIDALNPASERKDFDDFDFSF